MSYSYLGAPPPEAVEPRPSAPGLPPDIAPTLIHETFTPVDRRRGWVAVPTYDMREYVKAQILTAAAGFMLGVGIGATLGNILRGRDVTSTVTKVVRNRRTSRRRRPRHNTKQYVRWGYGPRRNTRKRRTSRKTRPGRRLLVLRKGRILDEAPVSASAYRRLKKFVNDTVWEKREVDVRYNVVVESRGKRKSVFDCEWSDYYIGGKGGLHRVGRSCTELSPKDRKKHLGLRKNAKKKRKTSRRTSARRRKRGRPAGGSVTDVLTVTMGGMPVMVTIDRSKVRARGRDCGWVHDLGTSYRAVPRGGGEARSFGTLAGAVKHTIRKSRAA